jgi:DNA-binding NarL/FixJ family response regulator
MSHTHAQHHADPNDRRVILVDERPLRRAAISGFLNAHLKLSITEATCIEDASLAYESAEAGVQKRALIILSIGGETLAGNQIASNRIAQVRDVFDHAAIIVISDHELKTEALAAIDAGADGFVPTSLTVDVTLACINLVLAGGQFVPAHILLSGRDPPPPKPTLKAIRRAAPAKEPAGDVPTPPSRQDRASEQTDKTELGLDDMLCHSTDASPHEIAITRRQADVLKRLRFGLQNKQIAYELHMSESTVKVHVRNIMKKFGATNRTQAAFHAQNFAVQDDRAGHLAMDPPRQVSVSLERVVAKVETGFSEQPALINRLDPRRDSITPQQGLVEFGKAYR